MDFNIDQLFDEQNKPASNWFKFEKVGDKCAGKVTRIFEKEAYNNFPSQKCFSLEQADGSEVNVGIKTTGAYLMERTQKVKVGDIVGFLFKAEIPAKVKGNHPAKSIEVFVMPGEGVKVETLES
jgi:hypothetical protein